MGKSKGSRVLIVLECTTCKPNRNGRSRYHTSKNRRNNPERMELKKYCSYCNCKVIHKEIK